MKANNNIKDRFLRIEDVMGLTGLKRTSVYKYIKEPVERGGGFPRPLKIGFMSVWSQNEVLYWIDHQKQASQSD